MELLVGTVKKLSIILIIVNYFREVDLKSVRIQVILIEVDYDFDGCRMWGDVLRELGAARWRRTALNWDQWLTLAEEVQVPEACYGIGSMGVLSFVVDPTKQIPVKGDPTLKFLKNRKKNYFIFQ